MDTGPFRGPNISIFYWWGLVWDCCGLVTRQALRIPNSESRSMLQHYKMHFLRACIVFCICIVTDKKIRHELKKKWTTKFPFICSQKKKIKRKTIFNVYFHLQKKSNADNYYSKCKHYQHVDIKTKRKIKKCHSVQVEILDQEVQSTPWRPVMSSTFSLSPRLASSSSLGSGMSTVGATYPTPSAIVGRVIRTCAVWTRVGGSWKSDLIFLAHALRVKFNTVSSSTTRFMYRRWEWVCFRRSHLRALGQSHPRSWLQRLLGNIFLEVILVTFK